MFQVSSIDHLKCHLKQNDSADQYGLNVSPPEAESKDHEVEEKRPKYKTEANGFIVHERKSAHSSKDGDRLVRGLTISQQKQRHLILGRDFEDILEACRPRNRGSSTGGTPPALLSQLKLFGLLGGRSKTQISNISEGGEVNEKAQEAPKEWNSINLDDRNLSPAPSLSGSYDASVVLSKHDSGSDLSLYSGTPSSTFTSNMSLILGRSPGNIHHASPTLKQIQIQQTSSVEIPLVITDEGGDRMQKTISQSVLAMDVMDESPSRKSSRSDSSDDSAGSLQDNLYSLEAMKKAMDVYDANVLFHEPPGVDRDSRTVHQTKAL